MLRPVLLLLIALNNVCSGDDLVGPPYFLITLPVESYILPILNYTTDQLEPYIDTATVNNHYHGHHEAYRKKLNLALTEWRQTDPDDALAKQSIMKILQKIEDVPKRFRNRIQNFGGGFVNHAIYWGVLSPNPSGEERSPTPELATELEELFGSIDKFRQVFTSAASELFGSGYLWLVRKGQCGSLDVYTTANQDCPLSQGDYPVLVIDVWEHAYYLKHQYKRQNHLDDWWMVVDWNNVQRLDKFWKDLEGEGEPVCEFSFSKKILQQEEEAAMNSVKNDEL